MSKIRDILLTVLVEDDKSKFRHKLNIEELRPRFVENGGVESFQNNPTDEGIANLKSIMTPSLLDPTN